MSELILEKIFVQYRDLKKPREPILGRKYTITHSDTTGEIFVFVSEHFAEDQVTSMLDEVRICWDTNQERLILVGTVSVDTKECKTNSYIRNKIFLDELPYALRALRHADRFLFESEPLLDNTPVIIHFISESPLYNQTHDFGLIGDYR